MRLLSPAWPNGDKIPDLHTRQGANFSPPISWEAVPEQAASLALICIDRDAARSWYHWLIWNIPVSWQGLPQHLPRQRDFQSLLQGMTSYHTIGYDGPEPPKGETHRYLFRLHALDRPLKLAASVPGPQLERALEGKILATAEYQGIYCRGE